MADYTADTNDLDTPGEGKQFLYRTAISNLYSCMLATTFMILLGFIFHVGRTGGLVRNVVSNPSTWLDHIWGSKKSLEEIEDHTVDSPATGSHLVFSSEWWEDQDLFQLERRAIFSKTWHYITHASRFKKPGDYRTFELAGFSIILILGKDKQLRAFQNICRHRAYQVIKKECGSSTVLGCRYHGWSYDTTGSLIKAPEFENIVGFDKKVNGLWQVKLDVKDSMVFINLDSRSQVPDMDRSGFERAFGRWDSEHVHCAAEWKVDGNFNWKLAAEDASELLVKDNTRGSFPSLIAGLFNNEQRDFHFGHSATTRRLEFGTLLTVRIIPQSAVITTIHCLIYNSQHVDDKLQPQFESVKEEIQRGVQRFEREQKRLLNGDGSFPKLQQDKYRQMLKAHTDAEAKLGQMIYPAAQRHNLTVGGKADDEFCRKLDNPPNDQDTVCSASRRGLLDW